MRADRLVLGGVRDVDLGEELYIAGNGITVAHRRRVVDPGCSRRARCRRPGASRVYVHIDLDVLDPAAIERTRLSRALRTLRRDPHDADRRGAVAQSTLVGATIAGFAPATPTDAADDLPAILRIIGALTRG